MPTTLNLHLLAAMLATVSMTAAANAQQPTRDDLARQLHRKVETLQAMRADRQRARQLHEQQVAELDRQIQRLDADLNRATGSLDAQRDRLGELEQQQAALNARLDASRDWLNEAASIVRPLAHDFAARIRNGIAFNRTRRVESFELAVDKLSDTTSAADHAPVITAVFEQIGDELAAAQQIELANVAIDLDNGARREHVWRLRLGLVGELFVSEDGRVRGLWADSAWRIDLPSTIAARVDAVFDIVREKQPPRLIAVPLHVNGEDQP